LEEGFWQQEEPDIPHIEWLYEGALSGDAVGDHYITIIADGPEGSASDTTYVQVNHENDPPFISPAYDVVMVEGNDEILIWTAYDTANEFPGGFSDYYVISEDGFFAETGDLREGGWNRIEYSLEHLSAGHHVIEIVVYDTSGNSDSDSVEVDVLPTSGNFMPLMLKLSGSFDYLLKEDIHLQLAALLVESSTGNPVTGATIIFDIYGPDGSIFASGSFEESTEQCVYIYTHPDTFKDSKKDWVKGIYLVYAHATAPNGEEAGDMIQFHIDPPGSQGPDIVILALGGFIGLLLLDTLIAGRYLWKQRARVVGRFRI
jgi:hypothetical protein